MSKYFWGTGLSWISPLRDIELLCTHVAIDTLTATLKKDNTQKYLVFLNVFLKI